MRLRKDLVLQQVRLCTPNSLTRRELLNQVSNLYDPVGLVAPVKQKGAILMRRAFQEASCKGYMGQGPLRLAKRRCYQALRGICQAQRCEL